MVRPATDPATAYAQTVINDAVVWDAAMLFLVALATAIGSLTAFWLGLGPESVIFTLVGMVAGAWGARRLDRRRSERPLTPQELNVFQEQSWNDAAQRALPRSRREPLQHKHVVRAARVQIHGPGADGDTA